MRVVARGPLAGGFAGAVIDRGVGFGGGVSIRLVSGRQAGLSLGLGLRYLTGGDVNYLTKGAIRRDADGVSFEPKRTPLSTLSTQIGIAVDF